MGIRVNVVSPGNIMIPGSTWEKKHYPDYWEAVFLNKYFELR